MRLGQVRTGNKFVFEDRGGVWRKIADDRVKCIFGKKEEYGTEIQVSLDVFVFDIFDRPRYAFRDSEPMAGENGSGMRIVIEDEDDGSVLMEINDANASQIAALAAVSLLRMKPPRKRIPREYVIMDTAVDVLNNALHVLVRLDKVEGKDIEEEEKDDVHGGAVQASTPVSSPVEGERDRLHIEEVGGNVPSLPQADGGTPGSGV